MTDLNVGTSSELGLPERIGPSRHVVSAKHGEATVLLNVKAGEYYVTHGVGCMIWELLGDNVPVAEIIARICREYDVDVATAKNDVLAFVRHLQETALVVAS
jgi:hypothetical protein